jgi:uncharacterized coiled-coil DUF342 family protein
MSEEEIQKLQSVLQTAKDEYLNAKNILDKITALEPRYSEAVAIFDGAVAKLKILQQEAEQNGASIQSTNESIKAIRADIGGYLETASTSIKSLQSLSETASELKGKIEGRSAEIDTLLKSSHTFSQDIEKIKTTSQATVDKTTALFDDFQKKVNEMQTAHASFLQIKAKIDNKDTGLDAILTLVQEAQGGAEELLKEINVLKITATDEVKKIQELKKVSTEHANEIAQSLASVKETKSQVEEISGIVIDESFADTFERRKNQIERNLNGGLSWRNIMLASVVLLVIAVLLPFTTFFNEYLNFGDLMGANGFFVRFFYTSPFIFLILFSAVQYSRERQLLERYAFKSASAAAARNHIDYLIKNFGVEDVSVNAFAVSVFKSVYNEPFTVETVKYRWSKREEKESASDSQNVLGLILELQKIITDEATLKQIIELLGKPRT